MFVHWKEFLTGDTVGQGIAQAALSHPSSLQGARRPGNSPARGKAYVAGKHASAIKNLKDDCIPHPENLGPQGLHRAVARRALSTDQRPHQEGIRLRLPVR